MHLLRLLPCLFAVCLTLATRPAFGDEITDNAQLLRTAEDVRVRTQAALALGASRDKRAVVPLCQGIADAHRVVRLAAATALARLNSGGAGCVRSRIDKERDDKVLAALQKTLARLEGALEPAEPAIDKDTKFYVAIGKLVGPERFDQLVRGSFVRGIASIRGVAIAPRGETPKKAGEILASFPAARGVQLMPALKKPVYDGGKVTIEIAVAIATYPDASIIGTFTQSANMSGVTEPDAKAEEELIAAVAESAMGRFVKMSATLE